MAESCAWVTLATNDSYCLGALVLAHSLKRASTAHSLVILVTPQVTPIMKERLSQVFKEVISVDVLDSGDAAHLALLERPELGITFTKLHCWSLTQYSKCVFLDADTLVLQNCDELFEREELSAAPDVGWPDCFNSGVFVYRPSTETFNSLIAYAKEKGSFDGGDQGLLNQYFSNWATGDISKHLPFLYNVCSTSFYSYLPALKQYGSNMKIVHFIGALKPWLQSYNWESRTVNDSGTLQAPLQHWWDIFTNEVHPILDVAMAGVAGALSQLTLGSSARVPAVEEHLRRQGWEAGNIDYMGADAFDNIWAKIAQTLSGPTVGEPASEAAPVIAQEPAVEPVVAEKPAPIVAAEPTPAPAAPVSKPTPVEEPLIVKPKESKETPAPPSSIESSTASSGSTASSESTGSSASSASSAPSVVSTDKEATAEEKGDNRQVKAGSGSGEIPPPAAVSAPLPKQMEKLVCHLKPAFEVDQLLTPDSEHEDAATIAQSIIASEEALYSPIITSATPPVSSPIIPILPQNVRDLSVNTAIPETPPVPALVSLAQIGILPSKQPVQSPEPEPKPKTPKPEPTIIVKPKIPEPVVAEPEVQPKTPEPEPAVAKPKVQPKTPEPKLQPKTPEPEIVEPKLQPTTPEPIAKPKLQPKTSEPEPVVAESKVEPSTPEPEVVLADLPKPKKMVKKIVKRVVPKTPVESAADVPETKILVEVKSQAPKTPDAEPEHKLVCSIKTKEIPAKTLAEIVIPDDLESIKPIKSLKKTDSSEKSDLVSSKPTVGAGAPEETATCQIKLKTVKKSESAATPAPTVDTSLKAEAAKGGEPSTPVTPGEEAPAKPKVKKLVKKVPATPKVKAEGDSEGADAPVPPPRKKIVKPKEKI